MSDLIGRQAAIARAVPLNLFGREVMIVSVSELENLPPAQPEIIRCKDCDYWNERQGRMYCGEMYFDQDDPNFYCGYARRRTDE